jgi:HEAT repeat protein
LDGSPTPVLVPFGVMRRSPAPTDFDGWVSQLGVASCRQRAKAHLVMSGSPALPALRRGLHHPKPVVRQQCVRIFDQLVDDASLPDLVVALDDEDPGVCARALHALACDRCKQNDCRPGEDLWVPKALDFLGNHPSPDIRAAAIDALGKVTQRRPDVVAALMAAAENEPNVGLRGMARRRARA